VSEAGTLVDVVRALLPSVELRSVHFDELHAARVEGAASQEGERAPVTIQMELHTAPDFVAYRFRVGVERSDVTAQVSVVAVYGIADDAGWRNQDVQRTFGELVALPAAYPYARTKLHNLTADMGVPPLVLSLIIPSAGSMAPAGDEPLSSAASVGLA
jgi:preprotein translocase subunit SecB